MKIEKSLKKILKVHAKKKKALLQKLVNEYDTSAVMADFIITLQMLRDYYTLTEGVVIDNNKINVKVSTLQAAIEQHQKSLNCIEDFYDFNTGVPIAKNGDPTETLSEYAKVRGEYSAQFWNIVADCMPVWQDKDTTFVAPIEERNEYSI